MRRTLTLTVEQVARLAHASPRAVRAWLRRGEPLQGRRVGKVWLVRVDDVARLLGVDLADVEGAAA
jgi:phage terminase Nu1 subunit (DNA packaging protein)